jgi:hypothetical protein
VSTSSKQSVTDVVRALTRAEQVTGAGCIVVIISVFLSWKGYASFTVTGLHSWGLLTLAIALVSTAFFVARSPFFRNTVALPKLPVAGAVLTGLGGYLVIRGRATGTPVNVEAPPPVSQERPLGGPRGGPRPGSNKPPSADG